MQSGRCILWETWGSNTPFQEIRKYQGRWVSWVLVPAFLLIPAETLGRLFIVPVPRFSPCSHVENNPTLPVSQRSSWRKMVQSPDALKTDFPSIWMEPPTHFQSRDLHNKCVFISHTYIHLMVSSKRLTFQIRSSVHQTSVDCAPC